MTPKTASTYRTRKGQAWQKKAFLFAKIIPELNYASRFYAKMLSRLRIYPAYRNPSDEAEPITEGPPVDLLDRIQDPGGGRSGLLSSYGRLMFITGEGYLFGRDLEKDTERWACVNTEEIVRWQRDSVEATSSADPFASLHRRPRLTACGLPIPSSPVRPNLRCGRSSRSRRSWTSSRRPSPRRPSRAW
jgi:hypothetical protein